MATNTRSTQLRNREQVEALMAQLPATGVSASFHGNHNWPVIACATSDSLRTDTGAAAAWFARHKPLVDQIVLLGGALMLRDFALPRVADFDAFLAPCATADFDYSGGATNRGAAQGRVFEATAAPADIRLRLHQEMAYLPHYPNFLGFYCHVAPPEGGETIIGDMRDFLAQIDPEFLARIRALGVLYIRNFRAPARTTGSTLLDSIHRTWQEAFYTDSKAHVEAECARMGLGCEWLANGSVAVTYRARGFINHPQTGQEIWFNQIATQALTLENFGPVRYPLVRDLYCDDCPPPFEARYGDGSRIDPDDVSGLYPIYDDLVVAIPYRQGDVLLMDNYQTAHGRNPYCGTRDVRVILLK